METTLEGQVYQTAQLDTFSQLHIARKLGRALPLLGPLVDQRNSGKDSTLLVVMLLGKLEDADADYITRKCLRAVSRQQATGWAPVQSGDVLMFSDMGLKTILDLVAQVVSENLGDFFRDALAKLEGATKE